ncbi:MAG: hypothetical protein JO347_09720 [Candidatus Eremiobacteraeota bacterium]|nr:hypothetical protein [Candidatus Eremiobacteraeota bacterium]
MQLQLKKVLNRVHPLKGFVYADVRLVEGKRGPYIEATITERRGSQGTCGKCGEKGPCYDHLPQRRFLFVPLWALTVVLLYCPRRVDCKTCGPRVEAILRHPLK